MRAAVDVSTGDHTTGHRTNFGRHEHGANLGKADDFFALFWRQHARHGGFELVYRVVNDAVVMHVHAVVFGQLARTGVSPHVKADHDRLGRNGQVDVGLADAAHSGVHHLHLDLVGRELEQGSGQCFLRTLYVGLDNDGQHLDVAA